MWVCALKAKHGNSWMDEENVLYIYIYIYIYIYGNILTVKKERNNATCSYMVGSRDYDSKWSKSERERPYNLYVKYKIWHRWTYPRNRNRLTDTESRLVVAKREGSRGGLNWEFGINRCKLLYIKGINHKVLRYSIGNYIQYLVINHNVKEYEKLYMYTYIYISNHFDVHLKLTEPL